MAVFPKGYNPNKFVSCPGERFKEEFIGERVDGDFIKLTPSGRTDLQSMYNEAADGCDINVIVARFANGDPSALFARQGSFGDIVGAPKDLQDAYQMIEKARFSYDSLDDSTKEKFGSFQEFLSAAGSKEWFDIMQPVDAAVGDIVKEEVKDNA